MEAIACALAGRDQGAVGLGCRGLARVGGGRRAAMVVFVRRIQNARTGSRVTPGAGQRRLVIVLEERGRWRRKSTHWGPFRCYKVCFSLACSAR